MKKLFIVVGILILSLCTVKPAFADYPNPTFPSETINAGGSYPVCTKYDTNNYGDCTYNIGDTVLPNHWTGTVDYGDGSGTQPLTIYQDNFSFPLYRHVYNTPGVYPVSITLTDNQGSTTTTTQTVTVNSLDITASPNPVPVGYPITSSISFPYFDLADNAITAAWDWGDGNTTAGTVTESNGIVSVSNTHTYASEGVYPITLTLVDRFNNWGQIVTFPAGQATYQYVTVYDPNSSFAGGRSYDNPASATPSTSGKVMFGITAKYPNNDPFTLTGSVKMNFKAANIDFVSTSLQSLSTTNGKAYLTGTGTVNGSGNYTFLASGIDGSVVGGNDLIRFQIKDASNNVIYDSQPGASDTADPTSLDATGNIRIQ